MVILIIGKFMKKRIILSFLLAFGIQEPTLVNVHGNYGDPTGVKLIESGPTHNILVTNNDEIFTFGNRFKGNLGDGSSEDGIAGFSRISDQGDLSSINAEDSIISVKIGINTTHILTESGKLFMFGLNTLGQLGLGSTNDVLTPILMNPFGDLSTIAEDDKIIQITTSISGFANTTHALTKNGRLFGWGANAFYGNVGNNSTSVVNLPVEITTQGQFSSFLSGEKVIDIENTRGAVFALTNEHRVFAWGYNYNNTVIPFELPVVGETKEPRQLSTTRGVFANFSANNEYIVDILGGSFNVAFRTNLNNIVYAGITAYTNVTNPIYLENFPNFSGLNAEEKFVQYFPTNEGFFAITNQSRLFAQGRNDTTTGYLGTGNTTRYTVPVDISTNGVLASIDLGTVHHLTSFSTTFLLTDSGTLLGWGTNAKGEYLGDTTILAINTPFDLASIYQSQIVNTLYTPDERVVEIIGTLPVLSDLTLDDMASISFAREQYDKLTTAEKALVSNYQSLLSAEGRITLLQQQAADQAAADLVIALINALPNLNDIALTDEDQVIAARTAYDALTEAQQALVTNYENLVAAEEALLDLEAANVVINLISNLPNPVTLTNEEQVLSVTAAWEALTEAQKENVSNWGTLEIAIDTIYQLNYALASNVIDLIDALPVDEAITKDDADTIAAARAAYDALTPTQQSMVTNLEVLVDAENTLAALPDDQGSLLLIVIFLTIIVSFLSMIYWFLIGKKKQAKPVSAPIVTNPITPTPIEPTIATIQLDDVKLSNFDTRPKFQPLSKVNPGFYLEITSEKESTNRVVEVQDVLPEGLDATNSFVSISKEEVKQVKLNLTSTLQFVKKTPGSFVDPGYYVEVDLQDKIVDNYILAKKRLPPSSAKGHRWIRIEKRKITK
jgi:alpha-tubulin suppressor-like RCC1 family protein